MMHKYIKKKINKIKNKNNIAVVKMILFLPMQFGFLLRTFAFALSMI